MRREVKCGRDELLRVYDHFNSTVVEVILVLPTEKFTQYSPRRIQLFLINEPVSNSQIIGYASGRRLHIYGLWIIVSSGNICDTLMDPPFSSGDWAINNVNFSMDSWGSSRLYLQIISYSQ